MLAARVAWAPALRAALMPGWSTRTSVAPACAAHRTNSAATPGVEALSTIRMSKQARSAVWRSRTARQSPRYPGRLCVQMQTVRFIPEARPPDLDEGLRRDRRPRSRQISHDQTARQSVIVEGGIA